MVKPNKPSPTNPSKVSASSTPPVESNPSSGSPTLSSRPPTPSTSTRKSSRKKKGGSFKGKEQPTPTPPKKPSPQLSTLEDPSKASGSLPSLVERPPTPEVPLEMVIPYPSEDIKLIPEWILDNFRDVIPDLAPQTIDILFLQFYEELTSLEQLHMPIPYDILNCLGRPMMRSLFPQLCNFLVVVAFLIDMINQPGPRTLPMFLELKNSIYIDTNNKVKKMPTMPGTSGTVSVRSFMYI